MTNVQELNCKRVEFMLSTLLPFAAAYYFMAFLVCRNAGLMHSNCRALTHLSSCCFLLCTGCGELPQGVELTVKLMVTGEIASALCQPRYAYAGRDDCPAGVSPEKPVLFEIQLLKFEKEANWHAMSLEERLASAEAARCRANSLYQRKRFAAAAARYGRLLNQLEGIRDIETAEQATAVAAAVTTVLLNLALAHHQNADYPGAVAACSKALEYDSASVKAYFRRGKAQLAFGEFDSAEADLRAAAALDASIQAEVNAALAQCRQRRAAAAAKQKREFGRFFG